MFSVERGLSQGDFISGGRASERLYVPELVINDWGNWTNMNVPVHEREENSHSNGRLLKERALDT